MHWDFQLKAENEDVYICGYLREVHLTVSEKLTDEEWKELINAIKADFSRVAKDKSAIVKSFEKYILFQNKYAAIANLCADLHANILDARQALTSFTLTHSADGPIAEETSPPHRMRC